MTTNLQCVQAIHKSFKDMMGCYPYNLLKDGSGLQLAKGVVLIKGRDGFYNQAKFECLALTPVIVNKLNYHIYLNNNCELPVVGLEAAIKRIFPKG